MSRMQDTSKTVSCLLALITQRDASTLNAEYWPFYSATVAKVSPSGFYVASADVTGTVRVWYVMCIHEVETSVQKPLSDTTSTGILQAKIRY